MSDNRPSFYIDGRVYISAGVLLYTARYPIFSFLMQHIKDDRWATDDIVWQWEDLGGKSDKVDKTIQDVAFRECVEETNGLITKEMLEIYVKDPRSFKFPVYECKYMLYVLYVDENKLEEWTPQLFGCTETLTGIKREIMWVPYSKLTEYAHDNTIQPRLLPVVHNLMPRLAERNRNLHIF